MNVPLKLGEVDGLEVVFVGEPLGTLVVGVRVGESVSSAGPIGVGDLVGALVPAGDCDGPDVVGDLVGVELVGDCEGVVVVGELVTGEDVANVGDCEGAPVAKVGERVAFATVGDCDGALVAKVGEPVGLDTVGEDVPIVGDPVAKVGD